MPDDTFNPDSYDPGQIQAAYHQAANYHDTEAMTQLHDMLLKAYQKQTPKATEGMGTGERFLAGMGHAFQRGAEGIGNILHVGPSDEDLKEEDARAKDLLSTGAGKVGDIAGQVAATAPLGMGSGAAIRAIAPSGKVLLNALRAGAAGGENAIQGAAYADPEHQLEGAGEGAVLGTALSKLGQTGGRLTRGLVEKSDAAQRLEAEAEAQEKDLFIPISQGAGPGPLSQGAKAVYQHVLPYALGAETVLKGQSDKAKGVMREVMAEMQQPEFLREGGGTVRPGEIVGNTPEQTAANLAEQQGAQYKKYFDDYSFTAPEKFRDQVVKNLEIDHPNIPPALKEQLANAVDSSLQLYSKDGQITGENLRLATEAAKDEVAKLSKRIKPEWGESAVGSINDIVDGAVEHHKSILATGSAKEKAAAQEFIENMQNYKTLNEKAPGVEAVATATAKNPATRGEFRPEDIAKEFPAGSKSREVAQDVKEVLGQSPGAVSPSGRHALNTAALISPFTPWGHLALPAAAGFLGGAHTLVRPTVQRALYGDTRMQRALADYIRSNPQAAYSAGAAGRAAVNE